MKVVRKSNYFSVRKARYPSLGGMNSVIYLLIVIFLRTQAVNNMSIWRDVSWWSL